MAHNSSFFLKSSSRFVDGVSRSGANSCSTILPREEGRENRGEAENNEEDRVKRDKRKGEMNAPRNSGWRE